MELTGEEERILAGEEGEARQRAMRLLVALGKIFGAERMIRVRSAQISGVSYRTIGDAGLEFLEDFAEAGAKASIKATLNPCGMDLRRWRKMGIPSEFAEKQLRIARAFARMGVELTWTCTPYYASNKPRFGQSLAWAESSAVAFANSVLGARTNREGGPAALASAVVGRTPLYGLHLESEREPTHLVKVRFRPSNDLQYNLLGYLLGKSLGSGIPLLSGLGEPSLDDLKYMGASAAASGGIALFHVDGVTPEAKRRRFDGMGLEALEIEEGELDAIRDSISSSRDFDWILLGCPHLSLAELRTIAEAVRGRRLRKRLICFTSRAVRAKASRRGYVGAIERAGGLVACDTCMVVSPLEAMGIDGAYTNSCKAAHYMPSLSGAEAALRSLRDCIHAAL
ncbi:MAG: aconitase X catalytic domain-containing protein [Candidatus Bathyarchaeia archaeon]